MGVASLSLEGITGGGAGWETLMGLICLGVVVVRGVASWAAEEATAGLVKQAARAWHSAKSLV